MKAMHSEPNTLFEGKFNYNLEWNSPCFFDCKIIVIMLSHNCGNEISRAINSVLGQKTSVEFGLLIVDDSDSNQWRNMDSELLQDRRIAIASTSPLSISQARNIGHYIVKNRIKSAEWICRLDADDELASANSLEEIYSKVNKCGDNIKWALSGNTLEENGQLLKRTNAVDSKLNEKEHVMKRLMLMAEGHPKGELPSCNLWIRSGFKAVYPQVESAEDHWLVAHLLLNQIEQGILLPEIMHAKYTLSGGVTEKNKETKQFETSRKLLYHSARYWIENRLNEEREICFGWGS